MRSLLMGVDSGTQPTKALVANAKTGEALGASTAVYRLIPSLPSGAKEQHPWDWIIAKRKGIQAAMKAGKARAGEVFSFGVSGQRHRFGPLDKSGGVIRPAKIWYNICTLDECEEITSILGCAKQTIAAVGNTVLPGFIATRSLWPKKHEPKNFARLATVVLPHDYLIFWLKDVHLMEYGDASGKTPFDVRQRRRSRAMLEATDASLPVKLPSIFGISA